jgi:hypothetical protein
MTDEQKQLKCNSWAEGYMFGSGTRVKKSRGTVDCRLVVVMG